ncbi:MAG: CehA/McbA family metallohydrolase [Candidatus Brocadiia bacterium]
MNIVNPFETDGVWLKANLHSHTTKSDGDTEPQQRVAQYAEAGYDVLAITDHRVVTSIDSLDAKGMTLLRSLEAHPTCPGGPVYHLVCLNVDPDFSYDEDQRANDMIESVRQHGGEVIVGHPYWCGHTVQQILALRNVVGLEVYNATCHKKGKADSTTFWDYLLATGNMFPAIAVDDVHRGRDIFMGWTMIRADSSSSDDVMQALKRGSHYSTCGPEFVDLQYEGETLSVSTSPVMEIGFICDGPKGKNVRADEGSTLNAASFSPPDSAEYVRVQLEDEKGDRAWLNPFCIRS